MRDIIELMIAFFAIVGVINVIGYLWRRYEYQFKKFWEIFIEW